ncbi:ABC transporter ATP-binding protein [Xylanimonas sp. McL0601]|uniref:ABC transporter ATP-binding protein n=1 Tax=Xylanimonas sp. McL0601 TaxID=3414739 RepID=UPI003CF2C428
MVLAARGVSVSFGGLGVLQRVDLEVLDGEFVAVVGPSGCGKSTLLRAFAGLLGREASVTGGLARPALDDGRPATAWMPQRDGLLPWRRALPNALVGARVAGGPGAAARERAAELFETFGLAGFERAWPHELSGGMRQRLALLRTCLAGRPVLLLDEPFGALDPLTRRRMNDWLARLDLAGGALAGGARAGGTGAGGAREGGAREGVSDAGGPGTAVVLVTHDVDEAVTLADRAVVLSERPGRVVLDLDVRSHPAPRQALLEALGVGNPA